MMLPVLSCSLLLLAARRATASKISYASLFAAHSLSNKAWPYDQPGPFGSSTQGDIKVSGNTTTQFSAVSDGDSSTSSTRQLSQSFVVTVTVTLPAHPASSEGSPSSQLQKPPFPVVMLINGFQLRASWYSAWAQRLATWGFAVVQYDDPLLHIIPDSTEVQFFPVLLDWMKAKTEAPAGFLAGQLDLAKLALAGHSRGGKLAGLLFAAHPDIVRTVFLIDPVDNVVAPTREYPSAAAALAVGGRPFGMIGAGRIWLCNLCIANHKKFWGLAPRGTEQVVILSAGHVSFLVPSWPVRVALKVLCPGCAARETLPLAMPPLLAWLDAALRPSQQQEARAVDYSRWIAQQSALSKLIYDAKDDISDSVTGLLASQA